MDMDATYFLIDEKNVLATGYYTTGRAKPMVRRFVISIRTQ